MTSPQPRPTKKRLFSRLLILYHLVILPIILLGIYLYQWSYANTSEEISRQTETQLSMYLENIRREIMWMETQQYNLLQDNELQNVALTWELMDNIERKESVNYLVDRLVSIKTTSTYATDVSIHIRSIDKSISALDGVTDFALEQYLGINVEPNSTYPFIRRVNGELMLTVGNLSRDIDGLPFYMIQIKLDEDALVNSLDSINDYDNDGYFILDNNQNLLWHSHEPAERLLHQFLSAKGDDEALESIELSIGNRDYYLNSVTTEDQRLSIVSYIPKKIVTEPLVVFRNWATVFALFILLAIATYSAITYFLVHRPLFTLVAAFRRVEKGEFDQPIEHNSSGEFGFIFNRFNKMTSRLKTLIDRDYKQTLMVQKAELKQLQSQINPHFLYNSFFILKSLAQTEDTERIEEFTHMLGEYFRFITRNENSLVDLKSEIKHARMYTDIQNMRFSKRIQVEFHELPKNLENIKVPKLIVQPIIENAYKYSLENKTEKGILKISFAQKLSELQIIIEDNGEEVTDEDIKVLNDHIKHSESEQESTGLINIHRRIELTYNQGSGLYLSRSTLNGLKVMIRLVF